MTPRFDDSLAQIVALKVPIAACAAVALALAVGLASAVERQVKRSWAKVPILGKLERTLPLPESISRPVLTGGGPLPAGATAKPMEKA